MEHKPIIFPSNKFLNLVNSEVACQRIIVIAADQLELNNFRNIRKAFILEHFFNILSAFKKLRSLKFFCLIVIAL